MRVASYVLQVLSEDEETQKQGLVGLFWPLEPSFTFSSSSHDLIAAMPIRISANHICLDDRQRLGAILGWFILILLPDIRIRTKVHVGE
jgi:hypothetical protein